MRNDKPYLRGLRQQINRIKRGEGDPNRLTGKACKIALQVMDYAMELERMLEEMKEAAKEPPKEASDD